MSTAHPDPLMPQLVDLCERYDAGEFDTPGLMRRIKQLYGTKVRMVDLPCGYGPCHDGDCEPLTSLILRSSPRTSIADNGLSRRPVGTADRSVRTQPTAERAGPEGKRTEPQDADRSGVVYRRTSKPHELENVVRLHAPLPRSSTVDNLVREKTVRFILDEQSREALR